MFSRTITRSTPSKRLPSPGMDRHGRTQAYRSNARRSATLTLLKPEPTGVVTGPLRAVPVSRTESRTRSGSGVPSASMTLAPASWTCQSMSTPLAATTSRIAAEISGPMPSPGMSVT